MKFIDFFAGVGGFRKGMEMAGHECVGFCEFDKYAVASYTSMHLITNEQRENLEKIDIRKRQKEILKEEYRNGEWYANDIRTVDARKLPKAECWCFGFPCQDISVAGKQLGFNGHRSSLFFAVTKLVRELKEEDRPKYLFIENVKNLLSVNGGFDFAKLLVELDEIGYDAEWQVLNSKDFGVPQNRERCFIIGHLRTGRKPEVFPIERTNGENRVSINILGHKDGYRRNMQTFMPDGITETLDTAQGGGRGHHVGIKIINKEIKHSHEAIHAAEGIGSCLMSRDYKDAQRIAIPVLTPERSEKRQNGRRFKENGDPSFTLTGQDRHGVAINLTPLGILRTVRSDYGKRIRKDYESGKLKISRHDFLQYDIRTDGITNTLSTVEKDNYLSVKVKEATKLGYAEYRVGVDAVNLERPDSETRRGRVGVNCVNTLDCKCNQGIFVEVSDELIVYAIWSEKYQCYIAVRKLTPKECFRLQGWSDDYFEKAEFVNFDSQLYKQAGNGVTVPVIYEIAKKMEV